jgi:hypothetical protein
MRRRRRRGGARRGPGARCAADAPPTRRAPRAAPPAPPVRARGPIHLPHAPAAAGSTCARPPARWQGARAAEARGARHHFNQDTAACAQDGIFGVNRQRSALRGRGAAHTARFCPAARLSPPKFPPKRAPTASPRSIGPTRTPRRPDSLVEAPRPAHPIPRALGDPSARPSPRAKVRPGRSLEGAAAPAGGRPAVAPARVLPHRPSHGRPASMQRAAGTVSRSGSRPERPGRPSAAGLPRRRRGGRRRRRFPPLARCSPLLRSDRAAAWRRASGRLAVPPPPLPHRPPDPHRLHPPPSQHPSQPRPRCSAWRCA